MRRISRLAPRAVVAATAAAPRAAAPLTRRAWTQHAMPRRPCELAIRAMSTSEQAASSGTDDQENLALSLVGMDVQHRDYISLRWNDGKTSKFHLLHLRAWCTCPECQHSTGQRLVNASEINPETVDIADIFIKGDSLNIEWSADHHKSSFTVPWLRENCYSTETLDQDAKNMTTTPLTPKSEVPTTEYADMMETDEGLLTALHQIAESGLAVIKNTPCVPGQVKVLAERIAPISHQFLYGDVFDVVAEAKPVNIAYTTVHLKHHLDLAYYESPPGFQFLHALRFDDTVQGGESTFVDVFAVAEEFRRKHPEHFETFVRVPATFQKVHLDRSNPAVMVYQRPHIQLNHRDEIIAVRWSPPFEGPLKVPFEDVKPYYDAYRIFYEIVEGGRHTVQFKLQQGDTVIFNQGRVLHGRNEYSSNSEGVRHLQGTYVNIDDAFCRYNALRLRFAAEHPEFKNRRAGNGNFA